MKEVGPDTVESVPLEALLPEPETGPPSALEPEPAQPPRYPGRRTRRRGDESRGRQPGRGRPERRRERREARLPADRVCPCCGEVVVESRRWVVAVWGLVDRLVVCLACWRSCGRDVDSARRAVAEREGRS
jgi:hypothetical protein